MCVCEVVSYHCSCLENNLDGMKGRAFSEVRGNPEKTSTRGSTTLLLGKKCERIGLDGEQELMLGILCAVKEERRSGDFIESIRKHSCETLDKTNRHTQNADKCYDLFTFKFSKKKIDETKMAKRKPPPNKKLGDGHIGVHYSSLSACLKMFIIKRKKKNQILKWISEKNS